MSLSSDLITQFVKITNDNNKPKSETTVYGTAVEYNGSMYVKLDGSDRLTPINTITDVKPEERVMVTIKDHTATITGNVSSPSARTDDVKEVDGKVETMGNKISEFEIVVADKVSVSELEAERGRIDNLVSENVTIKDTLKAANAEIETLTADNVTIKETLTANKASIDNLEATKISAEVADLKYATITSLEATDANIHNLQADYGDFKVLTTDKFTANDAAIKNLETDKLSVNDAAIKYANIDFANIGEAAVEKLFADSGIIKDLVVSGGHITGELVGVTIKGDLIEGNTVVAEKLVVKGEDGLYYKLNTDGSTVEAEQTEYNSLNGSVITAKSITATKVNVDDLVAFDATIGGFNITSTSIYSGVKESVDNSTRGIYLDNTGQVVFGDISNFLKYYKDQNGDYKLEISADSLLLGSDKKNIGTAIEDAVGRISSAETAITQNAEQIELKASASDLNAAIENVTSDIQKTIEEQNTSITQSAEEIILEALTNYTKTGDFEEYKSTVSSELSVLSDEISMNFTTTIEQLDNVNGELSSKLEQYEKHISFSDTGISITDANGEQSIELMLDSGVIKFLRNGEQFGWWDGVDFHTGNIIVDVSERAQFGNFAFIPRDDGSLSFLKVK